MILPAGMSFNDFAEICRKQKGVTPFSGRLLALDPGETTGWSIWDAPPGKEDTLVTQGQLDAWPMTHCVPNFAALLDEFHPTRIVYERYAVYEWKTDSHAWSDVPTLRIIGSMETHLLQRHLPFSWQTAQAAKNLATDELLKRWGFYQRGQRHSRDSMRHAIYYLCFGTTSPESGAI